MTRQFMNSSAARYLLSGRLMRQSALLGVVLGVTGCAAMPPPPPIFPDSTDRFGLSVVHGLQVSPTKAVVRSQSSGRQIVTGNFEGADDRLAAVVLSPRFVVTPKFSEAWHAAGYLDLVSNGLELRYLPWGSSGRSPLLISLGAQNDSIFTWGSGSADTSYQLRLGSSIQPRLGGGFQLLLGLGIGGGPYRRHLRLGTLPFDRHEADQQLVATLKVLRQELRADALVGAALTAGSFKIALAAQPYLVVAHGDARGRCSACSENTTLETFASSWGTAATATIYFAVPKRRAARTN